jgi:hypothetical protein
MIMLVTLIAFFVILPLSLVGFEMGRYFLMITQLENIAGASALAGTGAVATIGSSAPAGPGLQALYNGCAQEAVYCMQLNSVLGNSLAPALPASGILNNTQSPYTAPPTPAVNQCAISISFLNQDGSWHTDLTAPGAVKMSVTMSYTTKPVFSQPGGSNGLILSLMPTETGTASSTGGLPQLDVFLCFDLSGSMDDQTGVAYVNRYWDPVNNHVAYTFHANQGAGQTPDTIYNQTPLIQITGTQVNAIPPQNLEARSQSLYFNQPLRCDPAAGSEAGQLPGGCTLVAGVPTAQPITYPNGTFTPLSAPGVMNPSWNDPYIGGPFWSFTDMVVIPSANPTPGGAYIAPPGWQTTAVVEAEQLRGNLQSAALLQASQGGAAALALNTLYGPSLSAAVGKTPQQYWAMAALNATPSFQALTAGQNFVSTMNLSTDARFGLSTFSDQASGPSVNTIPSSVGSPDEYLISNIGPGYPTAYVPGGKAPGDTYPLPFVTLSAGTPGSYNQAFQALAPPTAAYNPAVANKQAVPSGQTDIYDAFNNAISDVIANGRPTARKAIVIFTDGVPTPTIANNTNAAIIGLASSFCSASTRNIPVYTIGLAQGANGALMTQEQTLLQGISAAGGNGGQYFPTTSASELNSAFQAIARSLVLLRAN